MNEHWLFGDLKTKIISGEAYEFRQLIRVFPVERKAERLREYAKSLGFKKVPVKYVIYGSVVPLRVIKMVREDADLKQAFYGFVFDSVKNKENWKEANEGALKTEDWRTALFLADALTYFAGGAWIISSNNDFYVWSKGYYEYTGA